MTLTRRALFTAAVAAAAAPTTGDTMKSDDIAPLLARAARPGQAQVRMRQGTLLEWDPVTGSNKTSVGGTDLDDLPVLASGTVEMAAGDNVAVLWWDTQPFILGTVRPAGKGSLQTRAAYLTSFSEGLLSTTFTDLATPGPSVEAYIGSSRQAIVFITANIFTDENYGYAGVQVSGASNIPPSPFQSAYAGNENNAGVVAVSASSTTLLTAADGLNEGLNTFTLKYRTQFDTGPQTVDFANRRLVVMPF